MSKSTVPTDNDATIERLLQLAGERTPAGNERRQRVFDAAFESWQQQVGGRQRRRLGRIGLALAASVTAAAIALGVWLNIPQPAAPIHIADVLRSEGSITIAQGNGERRIVTSNDSLMVSDSIETGPSGGASLMLVSGMELRLDSNTRIDLRSADLFELTAGRVYLDSNNQSSALTLRTPFGDTDHVGTQYELMVEPTALRVRVREGQVILAGIETRTLNSGLEVTMNETGVTSQRQIPSYGPLWRWTQDIAPAYDIDGKSLSAFLTWVSREGGYQLAFSDPASERAARRVVLHGSIKGSDPREALASVVPTTGFEYELRENVLTVRRVAQ